MHQLLSSLLFITFVFNQLYAQQLGFTPRQEKLVEVRFGIPQVDHYRWMENQDDPELIRWIESQNQITEQYLDNKLFHEISEELIDLLKPARKRSDLLKMIYKQVEKRRRFFPFKNQSYLSEENIAGDYIKSPNGNYEIIISSDSKSDLSRLEIINSKTGLRLKDILMVKFAEVFWEEDGKSFIYTTVRDGRLGHNLSGIFRHRLGTTQAEDELIYRTPEVGVWLSLLKKDNKWFIFQYRGDGFDLGYLDVNTGKITPITPYIEGPVDWFAFDQGLLYIINFSHADLGEIATLNLNTGHISTIIPEQNLAIHNTLKIGNSIFFTLIENASHRLFRFDQESQKILEIELPIVGTAIIFNYLGSLCVMQTSYSEDFSFWTYNEKDNILELLINSDPLPFDLESFRIFYRAHNGKQVPIWITKRANVTLTPNTPILLYGYGGFAMNLIPIFSPGYLPWYKRGGVCAFVTLPGGSEFGESWHKAGKLLNKENTFDDFAAAAKCLINKGYTNPKKLACNGESNGGLLVGAVVNRNPKLFRAAVPEVGVMDMTRFSLFTAGKWWVDEYGDINNPYDFKHLFSISPYHTIKRYEYPSVLVLTAEFDDRVVPSHSYKYAARLQSKQMGKSPILLHTKRWGSHSSLSGTVDEQVKYNAIRWAFLIKELDM